jgi:hypothetical protein
MATQAHSNMELIPRPWEGGEIEKMVGGLGDITVKANDYAEKVKALEVKDEQSCGQMKQLIAEIKALDKDADVIVHPVKSVIEKAANFLKTNLLIVKNRNEMIRGVANGKVGAYDNAERVRAEKERKEKQAEMDRKAREEADAKLAADLAESEKKKKEAEKEIKKELKAGNISEKDAKRLTRVAELDKQADELRAKDAAAKTVASVPTVKVATNVPRVAGTTSRVNYYAECVDRSAFISEALKRYKRNGDTEMFAYMEVSDKLLGQKARQLESDEEMNALYPGIRAYHNNTY